MTYHRIVTLQVDDAKLAEHNEKRRKAGNIQQDADDLIDTILKTSTTFHESVKVISVGVATRGDDAFCEGLDNTQTECKCRDGAIRCACRRKPTNEQATGDSTI